MTDHIVYMVVTEPGGIDGKDPNDQGGTIVLATFEKEEAKRKIGQDSRLKLQPVVVDPEVVRRDIAAKLNPVEMLFHQFGPKPSTSERIR